MMIRFVFLIVLSVFFAFPALASERDVDQWLALRRAQNFPFATYAQFLDTHAHWPDKTTIQRRAEESLVPGQEDPRRLAAYFNAFPPVSPIGRLAFIEALFATGQNAKAVETLRNAWREGHFDSTQQDKILRNYSMLSTDDHAVRLDNLLWQGNLARAEATLSLVSGADRAAGQARINLQRSKPGAANAPGASHPSAQIDLARFYRQKGQDAQAIAALNRYNGTKAHAAALWKERAILARRALENGNFQRAYDLAANHGLSSAVELADAEFLAGWLAVTRLREPQKAYAHFERMFQNVKTPISQSRAAYWAGVAAAQLGQNQNATQWYERAAKHMNTFYGQMAAYALGDANRHFAAFLRRSQDAPQIRNLSGDLIDAVRILNRRGMNTERDLFLTALINEGKTKNAAHHVIRLAREVNSPKMTLRAGKAAYDHGALVADALFPEITVPQYGDMEKALALAIIRQESEFDRMAVSSANARGLMQLLPATAAQTARQTGISHRDAAQLYIPHHNMMLGQAYLDKMLDRYDQFVPLAAAAYNAGPGNVDKWIVEMGDPRRNPDLWVDWVERIPFYETRNYVQRVWEAYSLYRAKLR